MPKLIQDQFSSIPSRQRRYQLRREAEGCCRTCGKPGAAPYCEDHRAAHRVYSAAGRKSRVPKGVQLFCPEDVI